MTILTVKLWQPHPGQSEILRHPARFKVVACGRRFGKTETGKILLIERALAGRACWWISPTYRMADDVWRGLKTALDGAVSGKSEEMWRLELPGGGTIAVRSGHDPDALRGAGLDLAVLDEAAYLRPDVWAAAIRPALADRRGEALFLSTPRGRNWFWGLFMLGQNPANADWNRRYFGEGMAVPAGIVAIRERVSDADYERLKREWRAAYGGRERKTAFLRGAAVEWHSVGLSQHDMDFLNARRFNREEIFQIFGIPVGMFSENATEANAQVGERVFIERTLWPKLVRIAEKITADLLPFYAGNLAGRFDDIRPQDRSQEFAEMEAARGILSINELRARYFRLGPVSWGEGPVAQVAQIAPPAADIPAPGEEAAAPPDGIDVADAADISALAERLLIPVRPAPGENRGGE